MDLNPQLSHLPSTSYLYKGFPLLYKCCAVQLATALTHNLNVFGFKIKIKAVHGIIEWGYVAPRIHGNWARTIEANLIFYLEQKSPSQTNTNPCVWPPTLLQPGLMKTPGTTPPLTNGFYCSSLCLNIQFNSISFTCLFQNSPVLV